MIYKKKLISYCKNIHLHFMYYDYIYNLEIFIND